jgi:hypothetical protein
VFPRRVTDRRRVEVAWRDARRRGAEAEHLIGAARAYADEVRGADRRTVQRPAAWLNSRAYDAYVMVGAAA